jgi:hypothetical protein
MIFLPTQKVGQNKDNLTKFSMILVDIRVARFFPKLRRAESINKILQ